MVLPGVPETMGRGKPWFRTVAENNHQAFGLCKYEIHQGNSIQLVCP